MPSLPRPPSNCAAGAAAQFTAPVLKLYMLPCGFLEKPCFEMLWGPDLCRRNTSERGSSATSSGSFHANLAFWRSAVVHQNSGNSLPPDVGGEAGGGASAESPRMAVVEAPPGRRSARATGVGGSRKGPSPPPGRLAMLTESAFVDTESAEAAPEPGRRCLCNPWFGWMPGKLGVDLEPFKGSALEFDLRREEEDLR